MPSSQSRYEGNNSSKYSHVHDCVLELQFAATKQHIVVVVLIVI